MRRASCDRELYGHAFPPSFGDAITHRHLLVLLGLLFSSQARAQATPIHEVHSLPGSSLTIRGSTSIGASWHCTSTDVTAVVDVAERSGHNAAVPDVRGVSILVPVAGLHCQNGAMDRAMTHALKVDRDTSARVISGRFTVGETVAARADQVNLVGALRVAGAERTVSLNSLVTRLADGSMSVHSELPLSLAAFGIAPPKLLFGTVRARDAITIDVDLRYAGPVATPPEE